MISNYLKKYKKFLTSNDRKKSKHDEAIVLLRQ